MEGVDLHRNKKDAKKGVGKVEEGWLVERKTQPKIGKRNERETLKF